MNHREVAAFIAVASAIDSRKSGDLVVNAWHDAIGQYEAAEALAALSHHRKTSTEYLMPAHIIRIIEENRRRTWLRRGRAIGS